MIKFSPFLLKTVHVEMKLHRSLSNCQKPPKCPTLNVESFSSHSAKQPSPNLSQINSHPVAQARNPGVLLEVPHCPTSSFTSKSSHFQVQNKNKDISDSLTLCWTSETVWRSTLALLLQSTVQARAGGLEAQMGSCPCPAQNLPQPLTTKRMKCKGLTAAWKALPCLATVYTSKPKSLSLPLCSRHNSLLNS